MLKDMSDSIREFKESARGFVFVKAKAGREQQIADKLIGLDEVKETHIIAGEWDVLGVLEVKRELFDPPQEKILRFVMNKVAKLPSVVDTSTIVPEFSRAK